MSDAKDNLAYILAAVEFRETVGGLASGVRELSETDLQTVERIIKTYKDVAMMICEELGKSWWDHTGIDIAGEVRKLLIKNAGNR